MYLGASKCELISDHDILNMFYDVLLHDLDAKERKQMSGEMEGWHYKETMIGTTTEEGSSSDDVNGYQHNIGSHWSWKDPSAGVCEWKGVKCNSKGEILSFRFPTPYIDE